eukprot:TRINITY_DN25606_c0_g1_i1.p1 TRINITY_DN25606_c0_g1~~TRINITY_DN25606_c0_g1_i1.p1  ORF type:complete len:290 (-),score=-4.43 TRINITY_DN25606_c0_g1_i1:167-943(-)
MTGLRLFLAQNNDANQDYSDVMPYCKPHPVQPPVNNHCWEYTRSSTIHRSPISPGQNLWGLRTLLGMLGHSQPSIQELATLVTNCRLPHQKYTQLLSKCGPYLQLEADMLVKLITKFAKTGHWGVDSHTASHIETLAHYHTYGCPASLWATSTSDIVGCPYDDRMCFFSHSDKEFRHIIGICPASTNGWKHCGDNGCLYCHSQLELAECATLLASCPPPPGLVARHSGCAGEGCTFTSVLFQHQPTANQWLLDWIVTH